MHPLLTLILRFYVIPTKDDRDTSSQVYSSKRVAAHGAGSKNGIILMLFYLKDEMEGSHFVESGFSVARYTPEGLMPWRFNGQEG